MKGDLPAFDVHAPLLSLPGIFRTSLETIPAEVPYLFADPGLVEHWRVELGPAAGFRIGIFWRGTTTDRARIIPLGCFESLAALPGVRLVSLQKEPGVDELPELAGRFPIAEVGSRLDDFMDTAAVLEKSGPRDHLRHGAGRTWPAPGRCRLGRAALCRRLALAARSPRQPLVSHDALVPPETAGRLASRVRGGPCGVGGEGGAGVVVSGQWPVATSQ